MGVRTNVPFCDLTAEEKEIVYHGPAVKNIFFIKQKTLIRPVNLILPTIMRFIQLRML